MQIPDISDWLGTLGLGALAPVFIDQGIDGDVLAELTDTDLRALGLLMGPRKKLLRAIAALRSADPAASLAQVTAVARPGGERRNLTLLFCDLVGSTALATRLDPEELGIILHSYMDVCTQVIEQLGGYVASYHGDGLMAFFGYPQAREDAAERAVRAALRLVEVVSLVPALPGIPLQARIGIATGLAVVGDLIGEGATREDAVVGQPPALAVRLQSVAPPGGIVISQATHDLLGGLFVVEALGGLSLKGFDQPQPAWRVRGEAATESRFAAAHPSKRPPMLGRASELAILLECWGRAKAGEGRVVLLSGEAGLGKSRVIAALREALSGAPHDLAPDDLIVIQCASYSQASALRPVIEWIERRAHFKADDSLAARQAKLDDFAALTGIDRGILRDLIGPGNGPQPETATPTPGERSRLRERTLAALAALLDQPGAGAPIRPRLLVFEDAHWSDTVTLELLGRVVAGAAAAALMVLISTRPDLDLPWLNPDAITITLDRLEPGIAGQIIDGLGAARLPAETRDRIAERAGGVPLFIEELTRSILEGDTTTLKVPATLHDTLMARLDRLGAAKAVAQTGAVLGRTFHFRWIAACTGLDEPALMRTLDELMRSGLVTGRGTPPDATYGFRHALIQDAAYHSMLRTDRMRRHGAIARIMERQFAHTADERPELVARHYTEAGEIEPALDWWQRAAVRASGQAAWVEAASHLQAALRLLETQPAGPARDALEITLRKALMTPLVSLAGYTTDESVANLDRLGQLLENAPPGLDSVLLLYSEAARLLMRSAFDHAEALARRTLHIAQRTGIRNLPMLPQRIIGYSALTRGRFAQADYWFSMSGHQFDPNVITIRHLLPHDTYSSMLAQDVLLLIQQGRLDHAAARGDAARAEAERLAQPTTLAYVLAHIGLGCIVLDTAAPAVPVAAGLAIAVERAAWLRPHADCLNGWLDAKSDNLEAGLARMRVGGDIARRNQSDLWTSLYILSEAALMLEHARYAAALSRLDDCQTSIATLGQAYVLAEVHRLRGQTYRAIGDARAESELQSALRIARQQGAKFYELRAATSLAVLWSETAAAPRIEPLLAPVLAGFTPGSDHPDLQLARTLLPQSVAA